MRLFLGVDGGQSGTVALIGDEDGRVVGVGRGPAWRLEGALEAVLKAAGRGSTFESACFGLSGGVQDREQSLRTLIQAERYVFTHDASIALTGAFEGNPGIIAIAGTGSIAFGRNAHGREARAGGWGYIFGDEGGAFDLVRQALRAALRFEEGWGSPTALREMLLAKTGATSANELLHHFYTPEYPRDRIAALAPLVDQAAAGGDPVAQDLVKTAAQALASIVAIVRRQLFAPNDSVAVSYSGGVFNSQVLRERFRMLVELEDGNSCSAPLHCPAAGALLQAYRAARVECKLQFEK